jgi:hypothetical protein
MSMRAHAFDYLNTNWVQMTECVPALGTRASRQVAVWIVEESAVEQQSMWSQEDHPARTFPWLDAVKDWMEAGADCSGTSAASLIQSLPRGFCGRTLLALSRVTTERTSAPCCGDLLGSDLMCPRTGGAPEACASALTEQRSGGCLTLATTEWPSDAAVCSLSQALEDNVDPKYYLSPKACAGILRRAEARGKALPQALMTALEAATSSAHSHPALILEGSTGRTPTPAS